MTELGGETAIFWVDLSAAGLIDSNLTTASATALPGTLSGPALDAYMPLPKLGRSGHIYVWSATGVNYYGVSATDTFGTNSAFNYTPSITVSEAYTIDTKLDDGLPQSGATTAQYLSYSVPPIPVWASAPACYTGIPARYFTSQTYNPRVNCALSFQFQ